MQRTLWTLCGMLFPERCRSSLDWCPTRDERAFRLPNPVLALCHGKNGGSDEQT